MIIDGYNKFASIPLGDSRVVIEYRPALSHERESLFQSASVLDKQSSIELFMGELRKRVLNYNTIALITDEKFLAIAFNAAMGVNPTSTEEEDAVNLVAGVELYAKYPHLPSFDCQECKKWMFDPITGKYHTRSNRKQPRNAGDLLLCQTGEKCPKGTIDNPIMFSPKNRTAFRHYLECRAVQEFPDDAIVKQNAKLISHAMVNVNTRLYLQF